MGSHRYRHICGCSRSGNPFIANLIAELLIDLRSCLNQAMHGNEGYRRPRPRDRCNLLLSLAL
jgi:hypothetical protein